MDQLKTPWQSFLLDEDLIKHLRESKAFSIAVAVLLVLLTTRFVTGASSSTRNGSKTPPLASYWAPYVGHVPRIMLNAASALSRLRNRYPEGIFSIRLLKSIHTIVVEPSLAAALLQQPATSFDEQCIVRRLMVSNFGLAERDLEAYDKCFEEVQAQNKTLLEESTRAELTSTTVKYLKEQISDLVTFNSYAVDHMDWERLADAELVEDNGKGERVMEASFIDLIRNFMVKPATAAIFGTDFAEYFQEIWPFLWILDEGFVALALDIPIWVPWPASQRARSALRQLRGYMIEYHEALDKYLAGEEPGPRWQDLYNVSALVKSRTEIFRKHGLSPEARAAYDISLLWALNANSTSVTSWALLELYQDPVLLAQVRDEIAPFVKIVENSNHFSSVVWVPPDVEKLDVEGLMTKCPLLMATYIETLRMYGGGWSVRGLKQDVVLEGDEKAGEKYVLKKGTYAHVIRDLHHSDPKAFPNPNLWQMQRHLKDSVDEKGAATQTADIGSIKPFDGSLIMCNELDFGLRKMLIFTSVLITMYEIDPAGNKRWKTPAVSKGAASSWPVTPIQAWVKRRQLGKGEESDGA